MSAKVDRLAIAVTCFAGGGSIDHLDEISRDWRELADDLAVFVISDDAQNPQIVSFTRAFPEFNVVVVEPSVVGHPYLFTWIHRQIFKDLFLNDLRVTHYLYLEDDVFFSTKNMAYWLEARQALRPFGAIPGFFRYEVDASGARFATDFLRTEHFHALPRIDHAGVGYSWVNFRSSYEGMWLMDRELFGEFLSSESFGPDHGHWRIRERATQGLIFENVPSGCFSRKFVGVFVGKGVDTRGLVHHVSNRYASDPNSRFAKILTDDVLDFRSSRWKADIKEVFHSMGLRRPRFMKKFRAHIS
jgi:hypothetical protein